MCLNFTDNRDILNHRDYILGRCSIRHSETYQTSRLLQESLRNRIKMRLKGAMNIGKVMIQKKIGRGYPVKPQSLTMPDSSDSKVSEKTEMFFHTSKNCPPHIFSKLYLPFSLCFCFSALQFLPFCSFSQFSTLSLSNMGFQSSRL